MNIMKLNILKTILLTAGLSTAIVSCSDDFVETKFFQSVEQAPLTSLTEVESFERGMYTSMRSNTYYGRDYTAFAEVRSDEMYSNLYAGYFTTVYNYQMTSADAYARDTYRQIYTAVAKANILINTDVNGIQGTSADRDAVRYHIGQAYVLRALYFFDLLKLYGQKYSGSGDLGVVTPLKYDPKALQARGTIAQNEAQIESDFTTGLAMMEQYDLGVTDRAYLNVYGAKALMSRFYLYKGDYAKVRTLVTDIVNSGLYQVIPAASYVGSWSSSKQNNSIFELAVGVAGANGTNSLGYLYNYNGYGNTVVEPSLYNQYEYTNEFKDVRRNIITPKDGEYYLYKYPSLEGADNLKLIRYEEVLLNGVEAEINGGNPDTARKYYNMIITNRGLQAVSDSQVVTIEMLKLERAKELVGEGFRQWDLLRWGDPVPRPAVASTDIRLTAFPIPRVETDIAGTPVVSNPGYDN